MSIFHELIEWIVNRVRGRKLVTCSECCGAGSKRSSVVYREGWPPMQSWGPCPRCHGTGEVWE